MMRAFSKCAAAVGLTMFLASAGAAWACSIALWYHAVPEHDATGVPLNGRVSVLLNAGSQPTFHWVREGATEEQVPFTVEQAAGDGNFENLQLVPTSPLAASARYRVEVSLQGEKMTVTTFTTGEAEDHTPPGAPSLEVGEIVSYVSEKDKTGGECWVGTGFVRLTATAEGAAHFVLRQGETTLAAGVPSKFSLAYACPAPDRQVEASLVAVDLAGNQSQPVPVQFTQRCVRESPFGCSVAGGAGGGVLGLLSVLLVAGGRRRRSS
jgi:MYXO-CTERM domain-containing protein